MGYKATAVVLHHSRARNTTKLVFVALAHHYDDEGSLGAWPSQRTLAKMANCSERTARRAIHELAELGEIDVLLHQGTGVDPQRKTNRYRIILDCPADCDGTAAHRALAAIGVPLIGQKRHSDRTNTTVSQVASGR